MKSICRNIAFNLDNTCLIEGECICEKNKLWIQPDEFKDSDPFLIWLDEEIAISFTAILKVALEDAKNKYLSLNKEEDHG